MCVRCGSLVRWAVAADGREGCVLGKCRACRFHASLHIAHVLRCCCENPGRILLDSVVYVQARYRIHVSRGKKTEAARQASSGVAEIEETAGGELSWREEAAEVLDHLAVGRRIHGLFCGLAW